MFNTKESIIEKTVQMLESLNQEISDYIDSEISKSDSPSSYMLEQHIRMRLECNTRNVRKYIRITREGSAVAFVCTETGNIYKPASYKAPAKYARGSVFSDQNGRESFTSVNTHGLVHVKYLR